MSWPLSGIVPYLVLVGLAVSPDVPSQLDGVWEAGNLQPPATVQPTGPPQGQPGQVQLGPHLPT